MNIIKYKKGFTVYSDKNVCGHFFFEKNNKDISLSELNVSTSSIKSTVQLLHKVREVIAGELYKYIDSSSNRIILTVEKDETNIFDYLWDVDITIGTNEFESILKQKKIFLEELKIIDFKSLVKEALIKIKKNLSLDESYGITINNGMFIQFALTKEMIDNVIIDEYLPTLKIYEKTFEE